MTDINETLSGIDIPKKAEEAWQTTKDGITDNLCCGTEFLKSNPQWTLLGALAAGVALGCLISHRDKPTKRRQYINDRLEDLQSIARTLSDHAARQAGRGSEAAVGAVESVLGRIKSSLKF